MARVLEQLTLKVLKAISDQPGIKASQLFLNFNRNKSYKDFYNIIFRLHSLGLIEKKKQGAKLCLWPTEEGQKEFKRFYPEKDGVWKIVIFDIPEKHKYVRVVLRAKLKALQFKKWQNSIWISPFELDKEIEQELQELSKKFFVRLIKTTDINNTSDLQKLFP